MPKLSGEYEFDGFHDTPEPINLEPIERVDNLHLLDVENELLDRYYEARELLKAAQNAPLGQKTQSIGTITQILGQIIRLKQALWDMERIRLIESTLIQTLQKYPELRDEFLPNYKKALENVDRTL